MKIKKIKKINFTGKVYNFSVEDNHNYLVNDILVSNCHYCYTSALKSGVNFDNIVDKALKVWGDLNKNDRPFQIAIGGAGESTLHPDWIEFVSTVKSLGILPNYTTNGMHLSKEILDATEKYCGGVAVSYHPHIEKIFYKAIDKLTNINTKVNCHIIIGDRKSLEDTKRIYESTDKIDYFVMLPYQSVGRAKEIEVESTWNEMFNYINTLSIDEQNKFAFGALFYPYLLKNNKLDIDIYEPEIYSGYRIFDDSFLNLRKSSYDLNFK